MTFNANMRAVIIDVLCSQALAEHLGDVRDAEAGLWTLIGIDHKDFPDDYDSAWEVTKYRLEKHNLLPPEHLQDEYEQETSNQEMPSHGDKGEYSRDEEYGARLNALRGWN